MNIEQMAVEAGICFAGMLNDSDGHVVYGKDLASFAALVRAQALEEAAAVCEWRIQHCLRDDMRRDEDMWYPKLIRALKASPDAEVK